MALAFRSNPCEELGVTRIDGLLLKVFSVDDEPSRLELGGLDGARDAGLDGGENSPG